MLKQPTAEQARRLKTYLTENGFSEAAIVDRLGYANPPDQSQLAAALYAAHEATAQNALLRLFLYGVELPVSLVDDLLSGEFVDVSMELGLLRKTGDDYVADVIIVPVEDFLIVSDAFRILGTDVAQEFVLPASTHSANFLRKLIMPTSVGRTLDLGSGCGIHALFAARHSETVIASDVSERATAFARFNALLNDCSNIECVTGDLFAAVGDQTFDLIVSNPPFVIAPGQSFTYRDNPMELDDFCRLLAREATERLNDGGHLQMLCETVELTTEAWPDRIGPWFSGTGCDAWWLRSAPVSPATYVAHRLADVAGQVSAGDDRASWIEHLHDKQVGAIYPAMVVLRKRAGTNWLHVHNLASDLTGHAGAAVSRGIAAQDFLQGNDDTELQSKTLSLSPDLVLEQRYERDDGHWVPTAAVLSLTDGMPMEAEVDMPVMAFLNILDGSQTLGGCLSRFAEAANAPAEKVASDLLPIVRMFVARGFVVTG